MRRSLTALLTVAVVLLAVNLVVVLARPVEAQVQPPVLPARHVVGITSNGPYVARLWSDGVVEINDPADALGQQEELFKGWRIVK